MPVNVLESIDWPYFGRRQFLGAGTIGLNSLSMRYAQKTYNIVFRYANLTDWTFAEPDYSQTFNSSINLAEVTTPAISDTIHLLF